MINKQKINEWLLLIVFGVAFLSLAFLVFRQFTKSEFQKILESDIKKIQLDQKKLLERETVNYLSIDSIKKEAQKNEVLRDNIIEKHYYSKEIINNKIKQDEKDIINSNTSLDSIKEYLSKYRYKSISNPSN